jgi:hypothetical protein
MFLRRRQRVLAIAVVGLAVAVSAACGGKRVVVTCCAGTWLGMTTDQSLRLSRLRDELTAFLGTQPENRLVVVSTGERIAHEFRAWQAQFEASLGKNRSSGRIPMQVASTSAVVADAIARAYKTPTLKNYALYKGAIKRANIALHAITAAARKGLPKGFVARFRG